MSTTYTFDDNTYSDLHKSVYGHRPRNTGWNSMSPAAKQVEWDYLCEKLERNMATESAEELRQIVRFENTIRDMLDIGADCRETAIRWIRESLNLEDYNCDQGYAEYELGLPYGYLNQT